MSVPARAASHLIDLAPSKLADALSALAQAENIEILFDQSIAAGKRSVQLRGTLTPEQALDRLLAGTGLTYRLSADGAYLIALAEASGKSAASGYADLPIEEILVIGHTTQNADVRRSQDDIQPYQVTDSETISEAQFTNADSFFKTYVPSNTQAASLNQSPSYYEGAVNSQIDLRGLGTDETMVLVDGRRLPSFPRPGLFSQPDVNGLPMGLVDRVETLGVSASGIFGIGAAGGAINFVMKRDFEGVDLRFDTGISARGDALHNGVQARAGYSIPQTGTHIMIAGSVSKDDGLHFGDRDIVQQARQLGYQQSTTQFETVASPSINFNSTDGVNLSLISSLGGANLNTEATSLPLNAPAATAGGAQLLLANAGKYDLNLSPDGQGAFQSLLTPTQTKSLLMTVRQDAGEDLEFYLDMLWLDDSGHAATPALNTALNTLYQGDPGNPFNQTVVVTYPSAGLIGHAQGWSVVQRGTLGAIYHLGGGWSADIDVAMGQARDSIKSFAVPPSELDINTLLGEAAFQSQLSPLGVGPFQHFSSANRMYDYNLRFGGPLVELDGGPLTLKAEAESVQEINPGVSAQILGENLDTNPGNHYNRIIQSAYLEARAPLVARDSEIAWLRGLELQLALRADRYSEATQIQQIVPSPLDAGLNTTVTSRGSAKGQFVSGTLGGRVSPLPGLTLRASIATGYTPPTSNQLQELLFPGNIGDLVDPKRGGAQPDNGDTFTYAQGGSPALKPQRTITYTAGVILEPDWLTGFRLSLDYSELHTSDEITDFANGDFQYFLDNEAQYPGRVVRAPLAPADAALGYTGGEVVSVDSAPLQIGRSTLQAIDLDLDYAMPTDWGVLSIGGKVTWEPSFRRWEDPAQPSYQLVGHIDGPLPWKSNVRLGWAQGPWSSGFDLQMYSGYNANFGDPYTALQLDDGEPVATGSAHARSQFYLDWNIALRQAVTLAELGETPVEYRFGIKNLLDSSPPVVASTLSVLGTNANTPYALDPLSDFSPYGDLIGRRFELTISTYF